jgi:hypothetical protein
VPAFGTIQRNEANDDGERHQHNTLLAYCKDRLIERQEQRKRLSIPLWMSLTKRWGPRASESVVQIMFLFVLQGGASAPSVFLRLIACYQCSRSNGRDSP